MRVVAIIQARMGSTRLPGKVLMGLGSGTVLSWVVHRLSRARTIAQVVVATTDSEHDDAISRESDRLGIAVFRGSELDVLDRYYHAAEVHNADVVVRITSDCPLIDADLVDATVRLRRDKKADYGSNVMTRTYPRGLDTEVFTFEALKRAWHEASAPHQREHVTPYFCEHPEMFCLASLSNDTDYSRYRWTVDTREDLQLVREICARLGRRESFGWRDVIDLMESEPDLAALNAHIVQKAPHGD